MGCLTMDKKMQKKIKKQLSLREDKLYCSHNVEKPCDYCRKKLTGDISGLTGNISSGLTGDISRLTGNISGIEGDTKEIIKMLKG